MGTSAEIKIRDMTFNDVQSVCEIENQSFYYATWTPEFFQNCLKSNRHAKIVAELDKKFWLTQYWKFWAEMLIF